MSPEKAIDIAKSIYRITAQKPITNEIISKILCNTEEQQELAKIFNF